MEPRAINVTSRFALLNVDDDSDNEFSTSGQKKQQGKGNQQTGQSKKKNKKKKKEAAQNAELRNIAFKGKGGGRPSGPKGAENVPDEQWNEWQQMDAEYTAESYEKDLEQAILLSKVDFEQTKQEKGSRPATTNGASKNPSGKDKKKKNKKEKNTMSLDEFNKLDAKRGSRQNSESVENGDISPRTSVPPAEADPRFFDKVTNDASKMIQKEKIQEQYKKHYIVESARAQQYQEEIDKRDLEIETLKFENTQFMDELKQVKKRNLQLCHILSQGEMKDKSLVLEELEQLRNVQTELTQQVADLTTELEKERSKVHSLKTDLEKHEKAKGGKHGAKH